MVWQKAPDGEWQILLKGVVWRAAMLSAPDLFLQSDSLLDDLVREQLQAFPMLHAGGVVDPAGRAAILCGGSGAGKTSLVTACILRGWRWLSDERLCFRQTDSQVVEGFRRNFNLKERSFAMFPETAGLTGTRELPRPGSGRLIRFFDPDQLPGGKFAPEGTACVLILPEYVLTASPPRLEPLSGIELMEKLIPELRTSNARTVAWLAETGRNLPAFTLRYAHPRAAAEGLEALLNQL